MNDDPIDEITDVVNAGDTTGVYYLVQTNAGYDQMTSFATLPTLSDVNAIDRPYHMFGVSSTNGNNYTWGDIGLVYFPDSQQWVGFYNFYEKNPNYDPTKPISTTNPKELQYENYEAVFNGNRNLYFRFKVTTSSAILDIIECSTWTVACSISYNFATNCVKSDFSTTKISKQITLSQVKLNSVPLNINTGTKMTGAQFSTTHLYLTGEYDYAFGVEYCDTAKRQGPTDNALSTVTYTNDPWVSDTVNISFN